MTGTHLQVYPTVSVLSKAAADLFAKAARDAVNRRGRFLAALSGGNTPIPFFKLLAQPPYPHELPWTMMHFFWSDERCVPADHPDSNYGQTRGVWLSHVPVPEENMHRIKGELEPGDAAKEYQERLAEFAEGGLGWPRLDFVLLGLGSDGHTASLFPGSKVDIDSRLAVEAVRGSYAGRPAERISLTPNVFNSARLILFLVAGEEKAEALAASRQGRSDPSRWPAQRIHPRDGNVLWLIDTAAASLLSR
jgi:6-phosphogluconolactonase